MVLSDSRKNSVVLVGCSWFSMFLSGSDRFSVVLSG